MSHIDVRFHFDEEPEEGYTYYDLVSVERLATDIPEDAMSTIGADLAQSDRWNVGSVGATLSAMTEPGKKFMLKDFW